MKKVAAKKSSTTKTDSDRKEFFELYLMEYEKIFDRIKQDLSPRERIIWNSHLFLFAIDVGTKSWALAQNKLHELACLLEAHEEQFLKKGE